MRKYIIAVISAIIVMIALASILLTYRYKLASTQVTTTISKRNVREKLKLTL